MTEKLGEWLYRFYNNWYQSSLPSMQEEAEQAYAQIKQLILEHCNDKDNNKD